jgi:hypothetical protein
MVVMIMNVYQLVQQQQLLLQLQLHPRLRLQQKLEPQQHQLINLLLQLGHRPRQQQISVQLLKYQQAAKITAVEQVEEIVQF